MKKALFALALVAGCALPGAQLTDAHFARIHPGMTQPEVRAIVGPPYETMPFPLSRTVSWDYRHYDTWGYLVLHSVTFDAQGRVLSQIAHRLNDGGDHR